MPVFSYCKLFRSAAVAIAAVVFFLLTHMKYATAAETSRSPTARWHRIDSLIDLQLTQSATDSVTKLLKRAKVTADNEQTVKALIYLMRLESFKEEDALAKSIDLLKTEIPGAATPVRSLLYSLLGESYLHYYQFNRWEILERTPTSDSDTGSIATWDLQTIVDHASKAYLASLRSSPELKTVSLDKFGKTILQYRNDLQRRPTLYDLLLYRAVEYFSRDDIELTRPAVTFTLNNSDFFKPSAGFLQLKITTHDSTSLKFHALQLLQSCMAFHAKDTDPSALVAADLKRLAFVHEGSVLENRDSLYLAALRQLRKRFSDHPVSGEVAFRIATLLHNQAQTWNPSNNGSHRWAAREAIALCDSVQQQFPESYGAGLCRSLADRIRAKELSLTVENAVIPETPFKVLLSYRNLQKIHWRQLPFDAERWRILARRGNRDSIATVLASVKPAAQWSTAIPDPGDFQHHTVEIAQGKLPAGHYIILCSPDPAFTCKGSAVAWAAVQVTRIGFVTRTLTSGAQEFRLLDRTTGAPLPGVTVTALTQVYDQQQGEYRNSTFGTWTSDPQGKVLIPAKKGKQYTISIHCTIGKDRFDSDRQFYLYRHGEPKQRMQPRTVFFTDRAIYRPGQTVFFKGIMLTTNGEKSEIAAGKKTTVRFFNVNGQEVAHLDLTANSFGTIHGSFTTPTGVLNGQMQLSNGEGSCYFSVEEYKRPTFSVTLNPYTGTKFPGDSIRITGKATAYAGQVIGNAQVQYRIIREPHFPFQYRYYYWRAPNRRSATALANGTVTTDAAGDFRIDFRALADPSIPRTDNPVFTYTLSVDVTDITGETRSATTSVSVGYTALHLDMVLPDQAATGSPVPLTLSSANANGVFVPAKGELTIHRLAPPARVFRSRPWKRPDATIMTEEEFHKRFPGDLYGNENDITTWKPSKQVFHTTFHIDTSTTIPLPKSSKWKPGVYVAEGKSVDRNGTPVVVTRYFTLYSGKAGPLPRPTADFFVAVRDSGEPGSTAAFLVGSGYSNVTVFYEIEHRNTITRSAKVEISNNQELITIPVEEQHRGGFILHTVFMHRNRCYRHSATVSVPWSNKELALSFETFRDKLTPGEKEQWRIKITGKKGEQVAAEMVAALYDASLDAFTPHSWDFSIYPIYNSPRFTWNEDRGFSTGNSDLCSNDWYTVFTPPSRSEPELNLFGYGFEGRIRRYGGRGFGGGYGGGKMLMAKMSSIPAPSAAAPRRRVLAKKKSMANDNSSTDDLLTGTTGIRTGGGAPPEKTPATPDLTTVTARTNLNETAFFFPTLTTNENGEVIVNFTIPEALTKWNMLGFAHTKDLKYGSITGSLVTRKELMVVPHAPRFFRENDRITFTAKVVNRSDRTLDGNAQLQLFDAATMQPVDSAFGNRPAVRGFTVPKGKSTPLAWALSVPEGIGAVTFRVVAKTGPLSDGEEQMLPVLTNRMMVTESVPLSIRGKGIKQFTLPNLVSANGGSTTLRNHRLTLEFTTNPVWYAVQALPYLIEYPYECAEQLFSRFYANSLASHIVNASPRIKAVFDQWRSREPDALLSNLEKNSDLKALALEETPWLLDGKNESANKQRVALLFDLNVMAEGSERALQRLRKMQYSSGGWPWFDGSPEDRYITQYITTGLGRLNHLGVQPTGKDNNVETMQQEALRYLDGKIRVDYEEILRSDHPEYDHLSEIHIQYLYMRSFFTKTALPADCRKAYDYFIGQAKKYWPEKRRYMQGMIALALHRAGDAKIPPTIIRSLKENALVNDELGMYWKEMYERPLWWWYTAPIESQALMIEVFEEIARDTLAVEACKTWLLKSKQTQNWPTTRSTAEACYALLLRGTSQLTAAPAVSITLGTVTVDPRKQKNLAAEAGAGHFKTSWDGSQITPDMGTISVTSERNSVAWGAVYWQYFEQLDKITGAATPLKIDKKLFMQKQGPRGTVLTPITAKTKIKPGDRLTVRIALRVDRDMEYMHMKDMRASGFEPLNVFSGYRWQDGLGYYESTRDAATNFFFPTLRKGTYVFEYPLVAAHAGDFSNGVTTAQCMYAPEFTSHSEGVRVKVVR